MADWKKITTAVGAVALAIVGGYFGFDFSGQHDNQDGHSQSSHSSQNSHSPSQANGQTSSNKPDKSNGAGNFAGGTCAINSLPKEADDVVNRILADQDHLYASHDGKHFGNYEGLLPRKNSSYYREYTVITPGDSSRGARRIVVGGGTENDPDVWYYTPNHYESFCEIPDAED